MLSHQDVLFNSECDEDCETDERDKHAEEAGVGAFPFDSEIDWLTVHVDTCDYLRYPAESCLFSLGSASTHND